MASTSGALVMVRHAQSEWNKSNQFTGWMDVSLTQQGCREASRVGDRLKDAGFHFDIAYTSHLVRAWKSLILILQAMDQSHLPTISSQDLNECKYGELMGINKDEAQYIWGAEKVHQWRRSYDIPPPGGESLKDVEERTLPYFHAHILPRLLKGENVLLVAHSNTLRSLLRVFDNVGTDVLDLEIPNSKILVYHFEQDGTVHSKNELPDVVAI